MKEIPQRQQNGEDAFELHSVQAVEKQIRDLVEKQAQLRERRAALETSQADAHKSGVSIQRAANTPTTSTPCVSLRKPRAPRTRSSQMSFTPAPGHDGPWVQEQRKMRAKPGDDDLSPSSLRDLHLEPLRSPPRDRTRCCDRQRLHCPARPCYVS
ncbi:hypothetical protein G5714_001008 [Onychostoma macrolepis]|uniref:Uncharacterized protein n=1 Tax=Onychostoma macrolepis TaxID=369639 RepID=A0A7J6DI31_9TELE|nr:hypothetical protein G5714_001008 [Onychostoma macrolepis]